MSEIFLHIVNMSISAGYVAFAVLLLRLVFKKAPKWLSVMLWGLIGIRLICPFSIESIISLVPSTETISPSILIERTPQFNSGISFVNSAINPIISDYVVNVSTEKNVNVIKYLIPIMATLWLLGMLALVAYTVVTYAKLRQRVSTAVRVNGNIYQSENVDSPFVLGIFAPKIYLPFNIDENTMAHVIAHEQAHIRRKDHLWKPLGFLILIVHWFNPLMWLCYTLLCRDIELACDEKVIKELDFEERADYSQALLTCSINRKMISACPLAFGEVSVKNRVKSALTYKKPAFWIIVTAIIASIIVAILFLTSPINEDNIGVRDISIKNISSDTIELNIKYVYPTGGYSVHPVPAGEGEYTGDGMIDYDGSLGAYRLIVRFGDTEPSKDFAEKFPVGEVVQLESSSIKFKRVHFEDHGFALYVGSDIPIKVDEVDNGQLKYLRGTIKIQVKFISIIGPGHNGLKSINFDIDNDGIIENCTLEPGSTYGIATYVIKVRDVGTDEIEYEDLYYFREAMNFSFIQKENSSTIQMIGTTLSGENHLYDLSIKDGHVYITENGVYIGYLHSQN